MLRRICKLLGFKAASFLAADRKTILDQGDTVPTDGTAGYAIGGVFMHRDGGAGDAQYINEGTETSCDFNAVSVTGGAATYDIGAGETFTVTGTDAAAPIIMTNIITTAGKTGGRALFHVQTNVAMGGWANGVKGYWEATGTAGRVTGLASGVCAELKTADATLASGAYYPLEAEYVAGGTSVVSNGGGTRAGFIYMQHSGDLNGDFDDNGYLFTACGLTAGSGHLLSTDSQTLKVQVGLAGSESTRYAVLSQAEDCLSLSYTASITEAIPITVVTAKTVTTGMSMSGAGTFTKGILLDATAITTAIEISAGSMTDAILISGTTPTDGIHISSACVTHAINIGAQTGSGITMSTTGTYGLNVGGAATTAAINIATGQVTCIVFGTPTNEIFRFDDDGTICGDANGAILANISGTTNAGFIKVVVGSADKYIALYDLKSS